MAKNLLVTMAETTKFIIETIDPTNNMAPILYCPNNTNIKNKIIPLIKSFFATDLTIIFKSLVIFFS